MLSTPGLPTERDTHAAQNHDTQLRLTLMQHKITFGPWAKVGVNLCDMEGRTLLIVCDYISGFMEVERLHSTMSATVSKALKILFA